MSKPKAAERPAIMVYLKPDEITDIDAEREAAVAGAPKMEGGESTVEPKSRGAWIASIIRAHQARRRAAAAPAQAAPVEAAPPKRAGRKG